MPHQEHAFRRDKVLYWAKSGKDRFGQSTTGSTPAEVKVRWDDRETLGRDKDGNRIRLDSSMVAKQRFEPESLVLHTTLADYVGTGSGLNSNDFYEVVTCDVTPDIKNRASAFVIGLQRYRGELPSGIG